MFSFACGHDRRSVCAISFHGLVAQRTEHECPKLGVLVEQIEKTRLELKAINGLDAEAELADIISAEILTMQNREYQHRQATGQTGWIPGGIQCPACKDGVGSHIKSY